MTERQIFEPDGRAIPYFDQGEGPALVLLPGRGLDISYLGILAPMLAEESGHRVVRIGSRRPTDGAALTMHDLAQDVVDVMDHVGVAHAWVGGHAFGGAVARTVGFDHTDRVNGLLLLGVEAAEPLSADAAQVLETAFSDAGEDEILEILPALVGDFANPLVAWRFFARARDAGVEPMQTAALASTPASEWAALAPTVPVLVLQGSNDPITPVANGEQLRASAPDRVSVVALEGGGHLFAATHAGDTAGVIEDYLDWD